MSNEQLFFGLSQVLRKFPKETGEQKVKRNLFDLKKKNYLNKKVILMIDFWYYIKFFPFIQIEYCVISALSQRKSQMASWVLIMLGEAKC